MNLECRAKERKSGVKVQSGLARFPSHLRRPPPAHVACARRLSGHRRRDSLWDFSPLWFFKAALGGSVILQLWCALRLEQRDWILVPRAAVKNLLSGCGCVRRARVAGVGALSLTTLPKGMQL